MNPWTLYGLALAGLMVTAGADAKPRTVTDPERPRALAEQGPVQVRWTDPAQFTEIRQSRNRWEAERGDWVTQLALSLRSSADRQLPPGQTLEVTLTDIKRAGDYEPWQGPRMNDIRVLRDIYPPRITLQYALKDAQGQVISEGERKLQDTAYLMNSSVRRDTDNLRYEKQLLDDWLRKELRQAREMAAAGG